jgi:MFS family permease
MCQVSSTVIATALPTIARSLGESPLRLNVAITCYLLSLAVFIPISGWVADRFGARRVFSGAIVVFTLGSVACGLSNSLAALVAARILQGIGGALMVPVGRLVLLRTVAKTELVRAMSLVSVPALVGPVMGPPLGSLPGWRPMPAPKSAATPRRGELPAATAANIPVAGIERSWTADERAAQKIKSQKAIRIPRNADPDALPDLAGLLVVASQP